MSEANISDDTLHLEEKENRIVHKRRSSIFNSQTAAFRKNEGTSSQIATSEHKWETCVTNEMRIMMLTLQQAELLFDLQQYVDELTSERKAWRKMCIDRKAERRGITKEKAFVEGKGQEMNFCILHDVEQNFIMSQLKYEDIYVNCKKLSNLALKMSMMSQFILYLNENYIVRMEENMYNVVKRVVRISESVP